MLNRLLTGVFGSRNERLLKQLQRIVTRINALEPQMQALSDAELQAKTPEFRERIAKGESLDKVLPEAFAVGREASVRVFGMRHFDFQLVGGMVLHMGQIDEKRTGECQIKTDTPHCHTHSGAPSPGSWRSNPGFRHSPTPSGRPRPRSSASASPRASRWTRCCRRPSRSVVKPRCGCSGCAISMSSWSAAWSCTWARSPRCAPARARP